MTSTNEQNNDIHLLHTELSKTGNISLTTVRGIRNGKSPVVISIDGPVSAGKTTIGKSLLYSLQKGGIPSHFYPESGHEHGVLDQYLTDTTSLSSMFQAYMFSYCLLRASNAVLQKKISDILQFVLIIVDRTANGNKCFAVANTLRNFGGDITDTQFAMYQSMYNRTMKYDIAPYSGSDLSLWVYASPEVCIRRMHIRGSESEIKAYTIPQYFWDLMTCSFLEVLQNLTSETPHPQIIIDWDTDVPSMDPVYTAIEYFLSPEYIPLRVTLTATEHSDAQYTVQNGMSLLDKAVIHDIFRILAESRGNVTIQVPADTPTEYFGSYVLIIN